MTVITKEALKCEPAPDWSAKIPRVADLYLYEKTIGLLPSPQQRTV